MISGVLVDVLHNAGIGLTKGVDLFAEKAIGEKCVVVSTTGITPDIDNDSTIRAGRVNIIISNYPILEGSNLGEKICNVLDNLNNYSTDYTAKTETINYTIKSTKILNLPVYVGEGNFYTINLSVHYSQE